jgi:hypothetical protein
MLGRQTTEVFPKPAPQAPGAAQLSERHLKLLGMPVAFVGPPAAERVPVDYDVAEPSTVTSRNAARQGRGRQEIGYRDSASMLMPVEEMPDRMSQPGPGRCLDVDSKFDV